MLFQTGVVLFIFGVLTFVTGSVQFLFMSVLAYFIWLGLNIVCDFPFQRLHGILYVEQMMYEGDVWYESGETEKALTRYIACELMLDAYDPEFPKEQK